MCYCPDEAVYVLSYDSFCNKCNFSHLLWWQLSTFMPFQEYDNPAESLVSGLSINYDDEDLDIGELVYLVYYHVSHINLLDIQ